MPRRSNRILAAASITARLRYAAAVLVLRSGPDEGWSERWDLNPRRLPWQGRALPLSYARLSKKRVPYSSRAFAAQDDFSAPCAFLLARRRGLLFHAAVFFFGGVAQLVRVPDCRSGCCGFESRRSRHSVSPDWRTRRWRLQSEVVRPRGRARFHSLHKTGIAERLQVLRCRVG